MLEEEKDFFLVFDNKGDEVMLKIEKEFEVDLFLLVVENSEVKDSNVIIEKVVEEVKILENGKEVEEVMGCDIVEILCDENEYDVEKEKINVVSDMIVEIVEDVMMIEKEM